MKQIIFAIASIAFFFLMLCFPKETLSGASDGLLLWFQIVLPTLLPFFIFTNLLIYTNSIYYISYVCSPLLQRLFSVSPDGSFAVLAGFLCGYPVGAKVTADLTKTGHISASEAKYLLSFCNNTSPAFIMSYIVIQNLKDESLLIPTMLILYLSPVLCSFLFRKFYHTDRNTIVFNNIRNSNLCFSFEIFDTCIMNAFENITKVGGYIILFSILFSLGKLLPITHLLPFLEITNGIPHIVSLFADFKLSYVLILCLTSFGGVCAIAQTSAMLTETKLSIVSYTIEKLVTALVTSLLAFLYVTIIPR